MPGRPGSAVVPIWFPCSRALSGGVQINVEPRPDGSWAATVELDRPSTEVTDHVTRTTLRVEGQDMLAVLRVAQHELAGWRRG